MSYFLRIACLAKQRIRRQEASPIAEGEDSHNTPNDGVSQPSDSRKALIFAIKAICYVVIGFFAFGLSPDEYRGKVFGFLLFAPPIVILFHMLILAGKDASSKLKQTQELVGNAGNGFVATKKQLGVDGRTGIAIDEAQKKVYLTSFVAGATTTLSNGRLINYKDLLSCELFEDGVTITKTVRSSQAVGAIVGHVLLGGVGTIIGGLSGKTESAVGKVNRIDIRLLVNDTNAPVHDLCFLSSPTAKSSTYYKHQIANARHWHGMLEVLIKRADAEERESNAVGNGKQMQNPAVSQSLADELKKLVELRDSGVLTDEEFLQQKGKLLSQ